jgi:hypothetical protein
MSRHGMQLGFLKFVILLVAVTVVMPTPFLTAAEDGTFTGTWIASGERQVQDFVEGREVFTFRVKGHVNLKDGLGEVADFWSACSGLWDAETGSTARCVWRGLEGQKVFIVMNRQPLKEGVQVTGKIIGGTGKLEGIEGAFTFTWTAVFIDEDNNTLTGHTENISGTYRLP